MLDYIRSLLSFVCAIILMYIFLDCELKDKRKLYLLSLFAAVVMICDVLILLNYGYLYFMKLYPLIVQLPVFLIFMYISKFKGIKVFFVLLTVIAITTSFSFIGLIISYFFASGRVTVNIVCYILYLPIGFLLYKYLRPAFLYMLRNTDKGWFGFSTIPLSYTILIYLLGKYNLNTFIFETKTFVCAILLLVLTISAYFQILRYFKQTREQLIMQNEQNLLRTQITAARMHLEDLKESQEKIIIYRHDMRHHLALIDGYLTANKMDDVKKHIAKLSATIAETTVEKYCNNYTVNMIIYYYISMAKNEDIKVETHIDLPEKNAVSDMDLCVIFANTIENAVNACKCIRVKDERILKIVCKTKNHQLFIQITNRYEGTVIFDNDMPVSNEENHGIGTKSIVAVVNKYGGVYSFTAENGVFKTSVIL